MSFFILTKLAVQGAQRGMSVRDGKGHKEQNTKEVTYPMMCGIVTTRSEINCNMQQIYD